MRRIVLVGSGGHCRAVADIIRRNSDYQIAGVLDPSFSVGQVVDGLTVLGDDNQIDSLAREGIALLITVGQLESAAPRTNIAKSIDASNGILPTIICRSAVIAESAVIGKGTVVFPGVVIGANVRIGDNCILNSNCVVEHDSKVGDLTHVSTSATVNGGCTVGTNCFVGSGAVVKHGVKIAAECVVGACSFVNRDIPRGSRVAGVPIHELASG